MTCNQVLRVISCGNVCSAGGVIRIRNEVFKFSSKKGYAFQNALHILS